MSDKVGLYCRKIECGSRFIPKDDSRKALAAAATLRNKHELDVHEYRHQSIDFVPDFNHSKRKVAITFNDTPADVLAARISEAILRHAVDGKRPV